jgi:4-aminobutyrate aminotransferase/(S)-3-amino-2-methylpropionate transaminase
MLSQTTSSIKIVTDVPGPASRKLMERRKNAVPKGPFHVTPMFVEKAEGALIHDVDGNVFIDFASGIGVTNSGHNNPAVIARAKAQLDKYLHTGFNVVPYEPYVELAEKLNSLAPGASEKKTFLVNSGAEAVENAIKFARSFTKKQAIVCFDHAYHGRTYMAMSLTAKSMPYKYGFAPFNSEVYRAPFPYLYRWPFSNKSDVVSCQHPCEPQSCVCNAAFEAFRQTVESQIGQDQVAGVIIEPVTGEGGFMPVPPAFMRLLEQYCKENGIVFMLDEIQTGFGRTGRLFAAEHYGVDPDLLILAKGLAGGMPLSAVTGRADILESVGVGGAGGTYCGNPVSCAAALAALDQFETTDALKHCRTLGTLLSKRLDDWMLKYDCIGDHRGLGPMRAVELVKDRASKIPYKEAVSQIIKYAYERGVICIGAGTYGNVLRFLIPLTASEDQLNEGLDVVEAGIQAI